MDFFEHQDRARRNTARLIGLFVASILAIIPVVYLVVVAVLRATASDAALSIVDPALAEATGGLRERLPTGWWMPELLLAVAVGVTGIVVVTSLAKIASLRGGGSVIAERLGGRPITADTADADERKIANVVEEMAIASGTPCPPVYIMDREDGINAFAAGYTPRDAVIGVTRGCVARLSRDELQGVVAHEFSHILNGDMRLNIRLIGIVHGIIALHLVGRAMFRLGLYSGAAGGRRREGGNAGLALAAAGGALVLAGLIGTFFGELIKASVSRQREFLADASAVQFTRNPGGIGGALKKIGGLHRGSRLRHPNAEEASHMMFGRGVSSMFSTHPPLARRIRRIEPAWDGSFPRVEPVDRAPGWDVRRRARVTIGPPAAAAAGVAAMAAGEPAHVREVVAADAAELAPQSALDEAIAWIGRVRGEHVAHARALLKRIPTLLREAARDPYSARAVVYALLLDADTDVRRQQFELLRTRGERGMDRETFKLVGGVERLPRSSRLPLIELTIGALRGLTPEQHARFRENVGRLAAADRKTSLFEWMLERVLARHLDAQFVSARPRPVQYYSLRRLERECSVLLCTMAYAGHSDEATAARAFAAGARVLETEVGLERLAVADCGLDALGGALDALGQASPKLKKTLLIACARCVAHDGEVRIAEAELLRAVADDLECPMPPLLAGQAVA
jgi:Zn-dependent protease with chaperone function